MLRRQLKGRFIMADPKVTTSGLAGISAAILDFYSCGSRRPRGSKLGANYSSHGRCYRPLLLLGVVDGILFKPVLVPHPADVLKGARGDARCQAPALPSDTYAKADGSTQQTIR